MFPFLAVGTLLAVGSLFGTLVCGWACPFGFLQDLVARIPTPKLRLPSWLGLTRYAVLAGLVILVPYYLGVREDSPWFICRLCPAGALEAAVPYSVQQSIAQHAVIWLSMTKTIILSYLPFVDAFPASSVVHAFLSVGGHFRPVELRIGRLSAVRTPSLQRLRTMSRLVQVPGIIGAAGERSALHPLL